SGHAAKPATHGHRPARRHGTVDCGGRQMSPNGSTPRRHRKRRTSIRTYLGAADRARLDRWAQARGIGPSTLVRSLVVDGLDHMDVEPTVAPDWRVLLAAPTGTHDRRR